MQDRPSPLLISILGIGIAILYIPILVLIGYSFNASSLVSVWGGFSTTWYTQLMHNDLAQFASTGIRCGITPLLANHAGSFPGRSIPEVDTMLTGFPATAIGYCFDPVQAVIEARAANGWEPALQAALPRLGAIALSDVALEKDGSPRPCPLGEGVVDWKKFFAMLAAAHFHGPVSMHMDYETRSEVNAMRKDLEFARTRVEEAWPV